MINTAKLQKLGSLAAEYAHQRCSAPDREWFQHYEARFAELIIKECGDVLEAEVARLDQIPGREVSAQAFVTARLVILNHFGII